MPQNAFQLLIEKRAQLDPPALSWLGDFLADLWQSIDAARLADLNDPVRSQALDIIKDDLRDAVEQVNHLQGYNIPRGDRRA